MPFNFDPNHYTSDPLSFSDKAKQDIEQMKIPGCTKIKIGQMSIGNGLHYILYYHRKCGLVAVVGQGDGEFGFQGLKNAETSVNKMMLYLDNIGQTDPESIPEMQLVRGHMFGVFTGTAEEMQNAITNGVHSIDRFFVATSAAELPRFEIDFFQAVLDRIEKDTKSDREHTR